MKKENNPKKKIKVWLQYPWRYSDSPYYKYLIEKPPKFVEYLNTKREKGATHSKRKLKILYFIKTQIRKWTNKFNLPIPNAHFSPKGDYELIHCAHCLSKNKNKPWVADLECGFSMFISGGRTKKGRNKIKKIVERKNCKKILPWTEKTKEEILEIVPSIKNKLEVVYPAIPERKDLIKKPKNKVNLVFSGRYFFQKGGLHALEVMDRLTKKHKNVYATFISSTPEEIKKIYSKNKKIKFYELIPQEKLFDIYKKAHILIYPGYSDSFGFAYLEAMSFGIPIVTVDGNARKEIVTGGKTGFVIDRPEVFRGDRVGKEEEKIIDQIVSKSSELLKNKKLREEMSRNCLEEIKSGKFSIKERDKKLKKIYSEAVRK